MSTNTFDLIPDNFISYDDDLIVKQEKLSDPDVTIPSHFSLTFDSAPFYPSFISPSLRDMLETTDLTIREPLVVSDPINVKRTKPFKIIRQTTKQEDPNDTIEVKIEAEKKVISNTRREYRREVAKKKIQRKMEAKNYPFTPNLSLSPDNLSNLSLDDKTSKKMVQMIRNRMSAQNSRDRRRNYVQSLEHSKDILFQENLGLSVEKSKLLQEMERLKESNTLLLQEREQLLKKQGGSRKKVESNAEQLDIEKYLSKLGIRAQKGMGVAFSLGLLLSVVMMMRINEQQNMLKLAFEGEEQVKTGMKSQESLLLEIEEKYMLPLRKCSQSTTVSSHGSPLLFAKPMADTPNEIDMSHTMACYNDGTDDGWGSLDHGISPLGENKEDFSNVYKIHIEPELHNKNFDMGGKDLLMKMHGSLDHLRSMRSHDNQTGALLDFNLFN